MRRCVAQIEDRREESVDLFVELKVQGAWDLRHGRIFLKKILAARFSFSGGDVRAWKAFRDGDCAFFACFPLRKACCCLSVVREYHVWWHSRSHALGFVGNNQRCGTKKVSDVSEVCWETLKAKVFFLHAP